MADNLQFSEDARIDIHRAKCYYDFWNKGEDFLDDLFHQCDIILLMPEAFQIRYKNLRLIRLEYFDYTIHYEYKASRIWIYRVYQGTPNYEK